MKNNIVLHAEITFRAIFENDKKLTAKDFDVLDFKTSKSILLAVVSSDRAHHKPIFYMRHRTLSLAGVNAFILIVIAIVLGVNGP